MLDAVVGEAVGLVSEIRSRLGGLEDIVWKGIVAALIFSIGLFIASVIRAGMRRSLSPKLPPHVYKPIENVAFYGLLFLAGMAALQPFGVNLSALLVAGGFAGIVVGFASQSALSNLVSGLMLLIEQPLRVGDPVSVAGVSGVVVNISVLSTKIRTWDGPVVRIPNNDVFNSVITNYLRMKARRVEIVVGVHYDSDIDKVVKTLKEFMEEHPLCLVNPAPEVFVDEYADSSINVKMRCWAPPQAWFATKVDLQTRVKKALDEAGIQIPYPQLDLHLVSAHTDVPVRLKKEE